MVDSFSVSEKLRLWLRLTRYECGKAEEDSGKKGGVFGGSDKQENACCVNPKSEMRRLVGHATCRRSQLGRPFARCVKDSQDLNRVAAHAVGNYVRRT